jgi:signal transduction histidine kinase
VEYLKNVKAQIGNRIFLLSFSLQVVVLLGTYALWQLGRVGQPLIWLVLIIGLIVVNVIISRYAGEISAIPLEALGKAIFHVAPSSEPTKAPDTSDLKVGREYVTNIAYQLYQIASLQDNKDLAEHRKEATQASNILARMPLPIMVFNKEQVVTFGSDSALAYCGLESAQLFGKQLFEAVDLEFQSDFTLESWIEDCQRHKATDTAYWRRVRLTLKDEAKTVRLLDIAGYYNRDNPKGIEFIISMFDRTMEYKQDEDSLNYTALAVHELRNPLTIMHGYIEVFEEELADKLTPELTEFMHRLKASAQQLTAFINNILNVARVNENQLSVKLAEENWGDIIRHAASDMSIRAKTLGKTINMSIPDELPTVAADRLNIYEVLTNLIDNAIKYSGTSKEVLITTSVTKDDLVETLVQDTGMGIPTSVIPNLFEKFQRNHRTSSEVSGTGLGLYLSKVIVNAHGGDIWVKSAEGEGTTVGFTLKPYSQVAEELKSGNNDMVRTAHGWIKNHSLYRR